MQYNVFDDLSNRGLVYQTTDSEGLRGHLQTPRAVYCGFDPTAPSLTVGNLVPILMLSRFQQAGHTPVVVLGGATGLIGDPSGKSAERPILDPCVLDENKMRQRSIFERLLESRDGQSNSAIILDNLDWLSKVSLIGALRDTGKFFSVNEMIQRDAIKDRLGRQQGMSLTEFMYGVLQALDFQYLHSEHRVTVELGGSDQWSNVLSGIDLVRRTSRSIVYGLTCPLVTKSDGTKFGKTESGPVWLSAERTSPYQFFQFLLNTPDADVGKLLRLLSSLSLNEIQAVERLHLIDPGAREAQKTLARDVTTIVHGAAATREVEEASCALFNGMVDTLPLALITEVLGGVPRTSFPLSQLSATAIDAVDLLCRTSVCGSKREARDLLDAGAISVNGRKIGPSDRITAEHLLHGQFAAIRKGKRTWHLATWQ
jgi:tyrosyl-tRNA synthetase